VVVNVGSSFGLDVVVYVSHLQTWSANRQLDSLLFYTSASRSRQSPTRARTATSRAVLSISISTCYRTTSPSLNTPAVERYPGQCRCTFRLLSFQIDRSGQLCVSRNFPPRKETDVAIDRRGSACTIYGVNVVSLVCLVGVVCASTDRPDSVFAIRECSP
jgi:hypothetical protein